MFKVVHYNVRGFPTPPAGLVLRITSLGSDRLWQDIRHSVMESIAPTFTVVGMTTSKMGGSY